MLRCITGVAAVAMLGACGAETEIAHDEPDQLLIRDVIDTRLVGPRIVAASYYTNGPTGC